MMMRPFSKAIRILSHGRRRSHRRPRLSLLVAVVWFSCPSYFKVLILSLVPRVLYGRRERLLHVILVIFII
jgi:hypothetical protein